MKSLSFYCMVGVLAALVIFHCSKNGNTIAPVVEKQYTTVTVGVVGGTFKISDNVFVTIPPNAVKSETTLKLRVLDKTEMFGAVSWLGTQQDHILCGFEGLPSGMAFDSAITVTFHGIALAPGEIPILHELNLDSNSATLENGRIDCDPTADSVCISVTHFCGWETELIDALKNQANDVDAKCKKRLFTVISKERDVSCTEGNCQMVESKVTVQFHECGTTESSTIRELTKGCTPKLTIKSSAATIPTQSAATVSAQVKIGCSALPDQAVDFSMSPTSLATLDVANTTTDANGNASVKLTSRDANGTVTVTARATVSYTRRSIEVNGETEHDPYLTASLSADIPVKIKAGLYKRHVAVDINLDNVTADCIVNLQTVSYSGHLEFDYVVDTTDGDREFIDTVDCTQSLKGPTFAANGGNVQPPYVSSTLTSTYAPSTVHCRVYCYAAWDSSYNSIDSLVTIYVTPNFDLPIGDPNHLKYARWQYTVLYSDGSTYDHENWLGLEQRCESTITGYDLVFPLYRDSNSETGCIAMLQFKGTYTITVTKI